MEMFVTSLKQNMVGNRYIHFPEIHNLKSPSIIVPYLIEKFHPTSVVDVGCGLGGFIKIFLDNGVNDVIGIDGNWIDRSKLYISENFFKEQDLEQRFSLNKKFDLVLCLEVAEHLSALSSDIFVENVISLGDIIIFSAAIKNQGGQNHINEQPVNYWIEKFCRQDFVFYDVFRNEFWNNIGIDWCYKQNLFLVAKRSVNISKYYPSAVPQQKINEYVHPELLSFLSIKRRKLEKIYNGTASGWFYFELTKRMIKRKLFSKKKSQGS